MPIRSKRQDFKTRLSRPRRAKKTLFLIKVSRGGNLIGTDYVSVRKLLQADPRSIERRRRDRKITGKCEAAIQILLFKPRGAPFQLIPYCFFISDSLVTPHLPIFIQWHRTRSRHQRQKLPLCPSRTAWLTSLQHWFLCWSMQIL